MQPDARTPPSRTTPAIRPPVLPALGLRSARLAALALVVATGCAQAEDVADPVGIGGPGAGTDGGFVQGTGGGVATGGSTGSGGVVATGGVASSGGVPSGGGTSAASGGTSAASGGTSAASGGTSSTGGGGSGGVSATGGTTGGFFLPTGGTTSTGGAGGTTSTGGATGTGGAPDPAGPCKDLNLPCFDAFDMFIFNQACFTCNGGKGCQACVAFKAE